MKAADCGIRSCPPSRFPEDRRVNADTLFCRPDFVAGNTTGWLLLLLATVLFGLLRSTPVRAAGVVGAGTPESCTEAALDAALAGGGLVTFDCGAEPVTIILTAEKVITEDMDETIVDGDGLVTLSGDDAVRVFRVDESGTLDVRNLTVAHGRTDQDDGGGIDNDGTLTVTNSTFSENSANNGGGIYNAGTLTVTNSTFSGNAAFKGPGTGRGGGIFNEGMLTVTNCTFSGRTSGGGANGGRFPREAAYFGTIGGGIYNAGTLTVTNSAFSENGASCGGGGIVNDGTLTLTNSTFSENSGGVVCGYGGGIINSGMLTVTNCTFFANNSGGGDNVGGAISNSGTLTVTNSTFSENQAGVGGGIENSGTLTVTNSTFSENTADFSGGGIWNMPVGDLVGRLTLTNAIIANNTGGDCVNESGTVSDRGHNLIGDAENACGLTDGLNGNIVGVDPLLDPAGLQDNGGSTETIALLPGSPAIDAGDPEACADPPVSGLDQRGYVRPGTGSTTCSIGAYEFDSPGPPPCTGDCDENGKVQIHELITLVNIALGLADVSRCEAGDRDLNGEISIDEILSAVSYALAGCPLIPVARACIDSGGELTTDFCCLASGDFPDTCAIGPCGCALEESHEVRICNCGPERCFDGSECVEG